MRTPTLTLVFGAAALVGFADSPVMSTAFAAPISLTASAQASSGGSATQAADGFEWFWALNGPVSADGVNDISIDADGTVFLAGSHGGLDMDYDGVVDIESGATAYVGARNSFFMKLSRGPTDDRVRLRWTRTPSNPADRAESRIAADGRGGAYASGAFAESLSFEDGPTLAGAGGNDAWIARYDGEGSVVWARVFGGPGGGDAIYGLASDGEANAYLVATGGGTFPLDDRGGEFRVTGARSSGLVSYGADGAVRWTRMFGPGAPTPEAVPPVFAHQVVLAPSGELFVIGYFEVAADLDGDGVTDLPAPRDRDGFVARFDRDGTFLDAWTVGGGAGVPTFGPDGDLFVGSMVGGPFEQFFGPADFDGDGKADVEPKGGPSGAVVARYSPEGDLRWVRSYALESPADLAIKGDRIALSGNYHGLRDLDEDGVPETRLEAPEHVNEETDLAILILSAEDGRLERVWTAPGPGNDWANAVAFSPTEAAVYVSGSIQLTADFTGDGENGEGWAACENLGDVFFAQYRLDTPREITLSVVLYEVPGEGQKADLKWSGATSATIDVYRRGERIVTTSNDGAHTDDLPRGDRGPFEFRVCEAGTGVCSRTFTAEF